MSGKNKIVGLLAMTNLQSYEKTENEDYMSTSQRAHIKKILEAWRLEIIKEVDKTLLHMQGEPGFLPDPVDRAALEENFSLTLRARDRERKLLKKIEKTLKQINHEDFGYCLHCGVEIGMKRLEARPTAELCIECKEIDEQQEKHLRS